MNGVSFRMTQAPCSMNFIVSNLLGARRFAGHSKMFAEATVYTGEQVIVESRLESSGTEFVRRSLSRALVQPLSFEWTVSKIQFGSLESKLIAPESCAAFDWPFRGRKDRTKLHPLDQKAET